MADAVMQLSPQVQMWVVFGIILVALAGYASEKMPMEVTSIGVICALMLFSNSLRSKAMSNVSAPLSFKANPALITVLALLVMGEAILTARARQVFLSARHGRDLWRDFRNETVLRQAARRRLGAIKWSLSLGARRLGLLNLKRLDR